MFLASPLACATKACFVMASRAQVGAAVDFGISWNKWNPSMASFDRGQAATIPFHPPRETTRLRPLCASGCESLGWRRWTLDASSQRICSTRGVVDRCFNIASQSTLHLGSSPSFTYCKSVSAPYGREPFTR